VSGTLATVGHAISDFEIFHRRVLFYNDTCPGVTEDPVLFEFRSQLGHRLGGAVFIKGFPDFRKVFWMFRNRFDRTFRVNTGRFRTAANQRIVRLDDDVV
jgi:hypothetical protein